MDAELNLFLARCSPQVSEAVAWGRRMRLRATACLSQETPPLRYVTSVRAVVLRSGSVLVQQDRDSRHVLPGGRREDNESLETTLRREISEETGWSLGEVAPLGITHFLHLDPKQPGYIYPHPHFLQCVYVADAIEFSPQSKLDDGYEVGSEFLSIAAVRHLSLTQIERTYLDAALKFRRVTS